MRDGYFPRRTSVLRRLLDERIVSLHYGQRALIVGALEPLAFTGTYLHSSARGSGAYFQRMRSTHAMFEAVVLGDRAEADRALRRVEAMHRKVRGTLEEAISPHHPAGTSYHAHDPWLSFFTMAVLADSATTLYETYVRRLTPEEREANWQDWRRFGQLFGMPADAAPDTWRGFRGAFEGWLYSDQPHLLPLARAAAVSPFSLPLPRIVRRPLSDVGYLVIVGTLPDRVRAMHGLPWDWRHQAAHLAVRRGLQAWRRLAPDAIAQGRTTPLLKLLVDYVDERSRAEILEKARRLRPA